MFITLMMVIVSWMFAYAQAHQTVHNKHMQFWEYINCASIKPFFKNKNVCWTRYPDKGYSRAPSYWVKISIKKRVFIYLAVLGLSWVTGDLPSWLWHAGSLVAACKLLVAAYRILVPWEGIELGTDSEGANSQPLDHRGMPIG